MSKPRLGYQLLSVYKDAAQDLKGTLTKIRDIGYEGVEFIGLFGHEATEVKIMLDELGLVGMSNMMPIDNVLSDPYKVISDCRIIGFKYVSLLVMDPAKVPGGSKFAETLCEIGKLAKLMKDAGIQLLYHHHGVEFKEFSGQLAFDFIMDAMPKDMLWPVLDCFWVQNMGYDPVEMIKKYRDRCDIIHLKDHEGYREDSVKPADADESTPFDFTPVGYGWQDVRGQVEAAVESNCKWLIVEQEVPSPKRSQYEAAKTSYEFVKSLGI